MKSNLGAPENVASAQFAQFDISRWVRLESDGIPIYVAPDGPDWFVPTSAADGLLLEMQGGQHATASPAIERFSSRLPEVTRSEYKGRGAYLQLDRLEELWLHLTDRCNLACSHCLFGSSPQAARALPEDRTMALVDEALDLGTRVFALTGGEPTVYPAFDVLVDRILAQPDARVAVLTNGLLWTRYDEQLASWPKERLHLQLSIDGMQTTHDRVRGAGNFDQVMQSARWLRQRQQPFTLSVAVMAENAHELEQIVELAATLGASSLHLMWYFIRGRGQQDGYLAPLSLFEPLCSAARRAQTLGVIIDNFAALENHVFSPATTLYDGSGAGWDSLAIGPDQSAADGCALYPSAATVGIAELASAIEPDLQSTWQNSPILARLRAQSIATEEGSLDSKKSPLALLLGGGDVDHIYAHCQSFAGSDPYAPLFEKLALWQIAERAKMTADRDELGLRLKMGDVIKSCGDVHAGGIGLSHSNCLLSVSGDAVSEFYTRAALEPNDEILNPAGYPLEIVEHVPQDARLRAYGCGSPILDAGVQQGEVVVDLGSGAGLECFIAARMVGKEGHVYGVDMLEDMLTLARGGAEQVAERLGYVNLTFRQGVLEDLPLEDASADVVISNCVINLCSDKRRVWQQVLRILRPGGRAVISDVVCETEPDASIRHDSKLKGECIAGAMTERDLLGVVEESGFVATRIIKRFPYREVAGHPFYSLTFETRRPSVDTASRQRVMYRGPLAAAVLSDGTLLPAGQIVDLPQTGPEPLDGEQFFVFDEQGRVQNADIGESCCCVAPEAQPAATQPAAGSQAAPGAEPAKRQMVDCMVCGAALEYLDREVVMDCAYCGQSSSSAARCKAGHFVCDGCHTKESIDAIISICLSAKETDLLALFARTKQHPTIPRHGPQYHAMVPGIILAVLKNAGHPDVDDEMIRSGIQRGAKVPGGFCGFVGSCGAALGSGAALAAVWQSNPYKAKERKRLQTIVPQIAAKIGKLEAARCCQRDCMLALKEIAKRSQELFGITLEAKGELRCTQQHENAQCMGRTCPLY
jgi:SAM-dependent methyltransferase/organic radical activating enzyme